LYFTGVDVQSDDEPMFGDYDDPHIRLREFGYVDDELVVYTASPGSETSAWSLDTDMTVDGVVELLFKDMFNRKAGLGA
jgi:hypothetical protein